MKTRIDRRWCGGALAVAFLAAATWHAHGEQQRPDIPRTAAVSAALFAPTLGAGYWLATQDRSSQGLIAAHKITAGANLVLLDVTVHRAAQAQRLGSGEIAATAVMNLCFAAAIATGAAMTTDASMPLWVESVHRVAPYAAAASSGVLLYLLQTR